VILVSLDGFRGDYLDRFDLPKFRSLIQHGCERTGSFRRSRRPPLQTAILLRRACITVASPFPRPGFTVTLLASMCGIGGLIRLLL